MIIMSVDEMRDYLISAQQQTLQNKILSAILTCFQYLKDLQEQIVDVQKKVNEIIGEWNNKEEVQNAAAFNEERDIIDNDIAAAEVIE